MQYKQNTPVFTPSGVGVGQIDRVVMDPKTREVTYLVVRKGFLFAEDKVVPIKFVRDATEERVTLEHEAGNLESLPPFEETQYRPLDWQQQAGAIDNPPSANTSSGTSFAPPLFWYPSVGAQPWASPLWSEPAFETHVVTNIPDDDVAIKKGARVTTSDHKHAGSVEEVITHAHDNKATHFVISHGLILKTHKAIPVQWIDEVTENEVKLGVKAEMLDLLPEHQAASRQSA